MEAKPHCCGAVPDVSFNRLNEHYREVVALARLMLRNATIETGRSPARGRSKLHWFVGGPLKAIVERWPIATDERT